MYSRLETLMSSLEHDLDEITRQEKNILNRSKRALNCIRQYCRQFTKESLPLVFKDKDREIQFFKELKPSFFSKMYYYTDLFSIESKRPNGSKEIKRDYLKNHLSKLGRHYVSNQQHYQYFHSGDTVMDDRYFVRLSRYELKLDQNGEFIFCDDDYSSSHDMLFSRIKANDMLEKYLQDEIIKLEYPDKINLLTTKLVWTDSKIALIETLYAAFECKSFNHGNIELKELTEVIGAIFGIDLSDYSKVYFELKNRNQRTRYIDNMKNNLVARMDRDDESN